MAVKIINIKSNATYRKRLLGCWIDRPSILKYFKEKKISNVTRRFRTFFKQKSNFEFIERLRKSWIKKANEFRWMRRCDKNYSILNILFCRFWNLRFALLPVILKIKWVYCILYKYIISILYTVYCIKWVYYILYKLRPKLRI